MSENKFGGRRRRGMRFRPPGGLGTQPPKPDKDAQQARAEVLVAKPVREELFEHRYKKEIERAENVSAGLPPAGPEPDPATETGGPSVPAETTPDQPYTLVKFQEQPKGILERIAETAEKMVQKVQQLVRPKAIIHKEIIINAEALETRVAIIEEGRLEEFTIERNTEDRIVGSIFKGRVRNLEDGLKAMFVDIGFDKNAFLHYWDIIPNSFDSSIEIVDRGGKRRERPKITQKDVPRLHPPGSDLVIQVTKGPIGTKGPRVTTNLVIPGRFLVLLPTSDQSGISRKIEHPQERQRLKKTLRRLDIPEGMGVIMRTAGEGQPWRYFVRDLAVLLTAWRAVQDKIKTERAPVCVFQEPDLIDRTVRDFLTEDVERIVIDSAKDFERVRESIGLISQRSARKVKLYNEAQPLFDRFNITRQLENAYNRKVNLKGGGYIIIDETEALVAIDVNTGSHKGGKDQDATIRKVNEEAADEICRQLRLRNMGGLLVLDFIDMKNRRDQQAIYNRMRDALKRDRAKTHLLPLSQLGLMEMTRQRHSESVHRAAYDDCPYCKGRGRVKSAITMSVEIQRKLGEILRKRTRDESDFQLKIIVHPSVLERLKTEDEKHLIEMEKRYFGKLSFRGDTSLHSEQFRIVNGVTNEELASSK